jgi:hypothetical protein
LLSSSVLSNKAFVGFRVLRAIRGVSGRAGPGVPVGVKLGWRSLRALVASAESSSGLQLLVCLSTGMSNLLNSCAATVQGTSGGGGEGARATLRGDPLLAWDTFEAFR